VTTSMRMPEAVEAFRRGEVAALREHLESDSGLAIYEWRQAWYRIWTVAGGLDVVPIESWGEKRFEWALGRTILNITGGPPRLLENLEELRAELLAALRTPPSRARHRQGLVRSLKAALAGTVTGVQTRNIVGLARHHTELPVDELSGWTEAFPAWNETSGWSQAHEVLLSSSRELLEWLAAFVADEARFDRLVEAGLGSASPPRRELCETLQLLPPG